MSSSPSSMTPLAPLTHLARSVHLRRTMLVLLLAINVYAVYAGNDDDDRSHLMSKRLFDHSDDSGSALATLTRNRRQTPTTAMPRLLTIRLIRTSKDVGYSEDGEIAALRGKDIHLNLYGTNLSSKVKVKLTTAEGNYGDSCTSPTESKHYMQTESFSIGASPLDENTAYLRIPGDKLPIIKDQKIFYFCLSVDNGDFKHQGGDTSTQIEVYELLLPIWLMIIFIGVLLTLSGLFSGLNLGLMALDQTELKIVQNTGSLNERNYANAIAPVRKHGNFLLCSLLLGNVLVNNTLTIMLDTLTSGLVAVIGATLGIVIFGEIIPQAICSRHGLAVGAHTIWLTKFFMLLTFPMSYPISKILDKVLGAEIGTVYDKAKLIELLKVTDGNNDLEKEERDIVTGALVYKDKKVRDVMTKLEDVYMLSLQTVLDFETVSDIRAQGYSRIPIFNEDRKNIVHILFAKDLMFIDPDDKMPLAMVCEFYSNDVNFVFQDTPLNIMFNEFKSGDKGHMAFVQDINAQGDGDPFYETIGLVTLEDIIEEIIQQEIVDETDVITDNKTKKRRKRDGWQGLEGNFQKFSSEERKHVTISPQLALAVFQYLTTSIEPFKYPKISDSVLKRLLTMDVFREIKFKKDKSKMCEKDLLIIKKGKVIDFFVLIIEGRVEVEIGPEGLVFESGPFTYFGIQALINVLSEGDVSSPVLQSSINRAVSLSSTPGAEQQPSSHQHRGSMRKTSTHNALDFQTPSNLSKRNSISQLTPATSNNNIIPVFTPDYTVKAVSDVLYLRIRRSTYIAALKASQISKKSSGHGELNDGELDNLLEKIAEDNADADPTVLMRTPSLRSPSRSAGSPLRSPALRTTVEERPSSSKMAFWGQQELQQMQQPESRSMPGSYEADSPKNNGPASWPFNCTPSNPAENSDRTSLLNHGEEGRSDGVRNTSSSSDLL